MSELGALDLQAGQVVGGYTLVSQLGAGAMGSVWRVRDDGGQEYAMKILRDSLNDAEPTRDQMTARERLRREAMALRKVSHPGVCGIVDMELDDALAFIVTELIEGRNLKDDVAQNGRYAGVDLERLANKLVAAVKAVHAAGIVHRDIKPTNVMVSASGPVLVDFGIAMGEGESHVTRTGLVMGTPGFIAPEIIEGAESDEATDWWSVASVLAFAGTGQPVFGTKPMMAVLEREASGNANLAGLPPRTMAAFRAALDPDRTRRCTPDALVQAIADDAPNPFAQDEGEVVRPFDPSSPRTLWAKTVRSTRSTIGLNQYEAVARDATQGDAGPTAEGTTAVLNLVTVPAATGTAATADSGSATVRMDTSPATMPLAEATVPLAETTEPLVRPTTPLPAAAGYADTRPPLRRIVENAGGYAAQTDAPIPAGAYGSPAQAAAPSVMPEAYAPSSDAPTEAVMPVPITAPATESAAAPWSAAEESAAPPIDPTYLKRQRYHDRALLPLLILALPAAAAAAIDPLAGAAATLVLFWILLTIGFNVGAQLDRESRRGGAGSWSDGWLRAASLPWHLVKGLAAALPRTLLAALLWMAGMTAATLALDLPTSMIQPVAGWPIELPVLVDGPLSPTGLAMAGLGAVAWIIGALWPRSAALRIGAGALRGRPRTTEPEPANPV